MYSTPQLISTEMIKPPSKTPVHLRKLKLSYLDQIAPRHHVPIMLFYQSDALQNLTNHAENISQKLKQSLSKTLTSFYPLAGRSNQENHTFDCNDMGCVFIESRDYTNCLSDVIKDPKTEQLKLFFPLDISRDDATLLVKITVFSCGGMAIGVRMSHKIGDGASMAAFMKAWADTCRGGKMDVIPQPIFDMEQHFPSRSDIPIFDVGKNISIDNIKRFVFDKERIALLKQMSTSLVVKDPTRVEVVSAFIWKHYIEAARLNESGAKKNFTATHAVNLRTRTNRRDVDLTNTFGNCAMVAIASSDGMSEIHGLVSQFRKAIRAVDNEYIMKSQNGDCYMNDFFQLLNFMSKGDADVFWFSSWTRFPFYEVDYGWGKPIWICPTSMMNNTALLLSTRDGDGIEAWVTMSQCGLEMLDVQFNNLGASISSKIDDE